MLRALLAVVVGLHAALHLLGPVKAFGLAELSALREPISRPMGMLWLAASALAFSSAIALAFWPRQFWLVGTATLVLSQTAIVSSWQDAKYGTWVNVLLFVLVMHGFLASGPVSLTARYEREVARAEVEAVARPTGEAISEQDLARLPPPVARYLRVTGFSGRPRHEPFALRFRGRIRESPKDPWMVFDAEQRSWPMPPRRLFTMTAEMRSLPVQALHRFLPGEASFEVRLGGVIPIVNVRGPELERAEAVTVLNDFCLLAPGALVSDAITWEAHDEHSARVRFRVGTQSVAATLIFDEEGLLRDFVSDDRLRSSGDGRSFSPARFSTPVSEYAVYGPVRLMHRGAARWHLPAPDGAFDYGEFELLEWNGHPAAPLGR